MNAYTHSLEEQNGAALIFIFAILVGLTGLVLGFLTMANYELIATSSSYNNMRAFYIAEAGLAKARWALTTGGEDVGWGETNVSFWEGTYTVTTTNNGDDTYTIVSDGYIPDAINPIAQRRVEELNVPVSSNLSLFAGASASSTQGVFVAGNATDGNDSSKWRSNVNNGSWLKLDFGSATTTTFDTVVIDQKKIDSYTIEYSDNDSTWTNVSNPVESPAWTITFDSVSARYLRLSVNGNRPEVNELESYNTDEAGDITLGQGTFATSK